MDTVSSVLYEIRTVQQSLVRASSLKRTLFIYQGIALILDNSP